MPASTQLVFGAHKPVGPMKARAAESRQVEILKSIEVFQPVGLQAQIACFNPTGFQEIHYCYLC